jgi:predicted nucleic acid-binding protein
MTRGLLDTSVLIALESGRGLDSSSLPDELLVSVVTIGELHAGIHAAHDTNTRATRMATLDSVASLEPLPVDERAAREWGRLRYRLHETGRRVNVNDLWIAAIAVANDLPIVTQDADYDVLVGLGGPAVVRV